MFSTDSSALGCFNMSLYVRMYGYSDSHSTNSTSRMEEPGFTDMGFYFQLRGDQAVAQLFYKPRAVSRWKLRTVKK